MKATRNTARLHRAAEVSSILEGVKEWAKRNITKEKVAEVGLASATAVAISFLGSSLYLGLQNYSVFAY